MKYIVGILIGLSLTVGVVYAIESEIAYREFRVAGKTIVKFVDPDNGNVCYMMRGGGYVGPAISCLK